MMPLQLVRVKRKDIEIQVAPDGNCSIRAPLSATTEDIKALVAKRSTWIETQQAIASLNKQRNKEYVNGESFLLDGEEHRLELEEDKGRSALRFDGRRFFLKPSQTHLARSHFVKFYKKHAKESLPGRVSRIAQKLGFKPTSVKVLELGARWGSCSKAGGVNFSWRLAMLPPFVVDYLIVHELTHLDIPTHSDEFWRRVQTAYPDYRLVERWLSENGSKTQL